MPEIKFAQVDPAKLYLAWDAIEEGLLEIKRRCANATWSPGHIYRAIRTERAQLWCGYVDGKYAGFVVLAESFDPFTDERFLLAWTAYHVGEHSIEAVAAADRKTDEVAKSLGIKKVRHQSPRLGWTRRLSPKQGWKIYEVVYERGVQ